MRVVNATFIRLYYLAQDIDTTDAISVRLHAEGVSDWNFHVLAKDPSGLYSHHIHSALPHHDKDIIRIGEIGGLYGFFASLLGSLLALFAGVFLDERLVRRPDYGRHRGVAGWFVRGT
jgi:hypothetical protein